MNIITIACLGDIMCGDSFYALGHGVAAGMKKFGTDFMGSEITDHLGEYDVVFGNIESPLSDKGRKNNSLRSIHMRGRPTTAKFLRRWGISVANVANNHTLEHGPEAAIDTIVNLRAAGIKTIGTGKDSQFQNGIQVEEFTCNHQKLLWLGVCLRREKYAFNGGGELDEIVQEIKSHSAQGKIVCISIHWGDEFMDRPNIKQKQLAYSLIEAGATIIVGHHPHVVQGIEEHKNGLIAYSLGNLIFDSFLSDCCWTFILGLKLVDGKVVHWKYIPVEKDHDHRPTIAHGIRKKELEEEINRRCNLLKISQNKYEYQQNYDADLLKRVRQARKQLRHQLRRKCWKMRPIFWPQLLFRPIQRRLGIW